MSLFNCYKTNCVRMVQSRTEDGSGGYMTAWTEGDTFQAAIVRDTSTQARIAEAAGTVNVYTVTVPRTVRLKFHDVFKRVSDGKVFRITSDNAEKQTPACATLDMAQSTAEAWRLTE